MNRKALRRVGGEWTIVVASGLLGAVAVAVAEACYNSGGLHLNGVGRTKGNVMFGLLGLSLGSVAGVLVLSHFIRGARWLDPLRIGLATIGSICGTLAAVLMADTLGSWYLLLAPALTAAAAQCGDHLGAVLRRAR
jgi:hypothetical protein